MSVDQPQSTAIDRLPDSIRVGPFDFRIEKWTAAQATSAQRFGECSFIEQRIAIASYIASPIKALDTLLHEIGHAIFWAYVIKETDDEERTVGMLATAWVQVYRDNPWLTGWIEGCLCPRPRQRIPGITS